MIIAIAKESIATERKHLGNHPPFYKTLMMSLFVLNMAHAKRFGQINGSLRFYAASITPLLPFPCLCFLMRWRRLTIKE